MVKIRVEKLPAPTYRRERAMTVYSFEARQDEFGDWGVVLDQLTETADLVRPLSKSKAKALAAALNSLVKQATWQPKREIAIKFRESFPESRRHLENHKEDARFGTDIVGVEPFRVQCKKLKKYAPITCIEEVDADRVLGEIPVLVTAGDRQEPMAVLPFEDFMHLALSYMKDWYPHRMGWNK